MRKLPENGFTLVELLVSVAIAAILISIAAPSYVALTNTNRLATQANDILGGLMIARSEAIRLNQRVVFCRSDDGSTCSAATDGWKGWLVFADTDGTDTPSASEILRSGTISNASGMSVLASAAISAGSSMDVIFKFSIVYLQTYLFFGWSCGGSFRLSVRAGRKRICKPVFPPDIRGRKRAALIKCIVPFRAS